MVSFILLAAVQTSKLNVPLTWSGQWSTQKNAKVLVARTPSQWRDVWSDRLAPTRSKASKAASTKFPKVDFAKYIVVAVFGGQRSGTNGFIAYDLTTDGKTLTLRYLPTSFHLASRPGAEEAKGPGTPFAFFLLPFHGENSVRAIEGTRKVPGGPFSARAEKLAPIKR